MADIFDAKKRSEVMSRIRGKGNRSTEGQAIKLMRAAGIAGWRRGSRLTGKPDFVFSKQRVAIFVDGCFWHGCSLHYRQPATNVEFWQEKIGGNQKRDRAVARKLRQDGWKALRFWEHDFKTEPSRIRLIKRLSKALG